MTTDNITLDAPEETPRGPAPRADAGPSVLTLLRVVMPTVVVIGIFAVLTNHAKDPLSNTDTYFHLRFGHEFLHGDWTLLDPGSVTTFGTADWVPTQWLPQIVMAQVEDWFGLAGVAWLSGLIYIGLGFTIWTIARRYASPLGAAPVTVVTILAASPSMSMRPQVLSYIFIAVITAAWLATHEDRKVRWWLVPATWLWAMVHGMWPVGIIISVVAIVGIALDRAATPKQWLRLALVPLLSAAGAAVTPVGPALYGAVLEVSSRGRYFSEWQPPNFRDPNCIALMILVALVLLRWSRKQGPRSWTEILLVLLAGGWALYTDRTVTVGAMMLVPFAAAATQDALGVLYPLKARERLSVLAGGAACLAVLAVLVPRTADEPPPEQEPPWYSSAVGELPAGTVVLNDWGEGGYLMWRFPDLDFIINGYGDIYTDAELERNYQIDATIPGWDVTVQRTGARYALLRPGSRLAYNLDHLEDWKVLENSHDLVLLEAPGSWPDLSED